MTDVRHGLIGAPAEWEITLRTGVRMKCWAHAYATEDEEYVFSLFFDGTPPARFIVLRMPAEMVETVYG